MDIIVNTQTDMNVTQEHWDDIFGKPTPTREISDEDMEYIINQQGGCR